MYIRKIESVFQSWMDTPSHKPMVVKGVRQCGKTSSVVDFANKHFKHIVYLDFREHPDYKMLLICIPWTLRNGYGQTASNRCTSTI